jgi:ubiquinone/menaquinone biosynthesis C-methylase UbiE
VSLKHSYRLIAPFYDAVVRAPLMRARQQSLTAIPTDGELDILLSGVGTGLDLAYLPPRHRYVGADLVDAMLVRARERARHLDCALVRADAMCLPFADASFDLAVLHLIVAVVETPVLALKEAHRVTRNGGRILVLDKFLRRGRAAPLRRLLSPVAGRIATRLDVVFEDLLAEIPGLQVVSDEPALANGWFRRIVLEKRTRTEIGAARTQELVRHQSPTAC